MALEAARAGARLLREAGLPRPGAAATQKAAGDYVTEWDLAAEHAILEVLARLAPGVPVLAEEGGGSRSGTMWTVDPLDGTRNFTRGFPVVGVAVGLLDRGRPVAGAVLAPYLDLEFAAEQGGGATRNGEPLPHLGSEPVSSALVATGFPFRRRQRRERYLAVFAGALDRFEDLRRPGAAALDLAWTAGGTFSGFFEVGLGTWDVVAGAAILREAGGVITDWAGGQGWPESGDVLAGSPAVHEVLLELAAAAPE